jgi:stage IV sporulation protein FB
MFGASETPYDLRFQALGIPVRVHPMFWLVMGILGWEPENMGAVLIFIGCAFLSILVHEYGHGLTARAFGSPASILLWGLGGLCYSNSDRQSPAQRLAVVALGPGAGFVLCGVVMILFSALFGLTLQEHLSFVQRLFGVRTEHLQSAYEKLGQVRGSEALNPRFEVYADLVRINIFWGLLNILPIWPLDGGRICEIVLSQLNPFNGRRWTHVVSLITAALFALMIYSLSHSLWNTIFFAYFAVINYQMLDSIHRAQSLGLYDDDRWRT